MENPIKIRVFLEKWFSIFTLYILITLILYLGINGLSILACSLISIVWTTSIIIFFVIIRKHQLSNNY